MLSKKPKQLYKYFGYFFTKFCCQEFSKIAQSLLPSGLKPVFIYYYLQLKDCMIETQYWLSGWKTSPLTPL